MQTLWIEKAARELRVNGYVYTWHLLRHDHGITRYRAFRIMLAADLLLSKRPYIFG